MSNPWDVPERAVTPEREHLSRRRWLKWAALAAGGTAAAAGGVWWWLYGGSDADVLAAGRVDSPAADLFPAPLARTFADLDRPLTAEAAAARYCNFYEFSIAKNVWRSVRRFQPVPWTLEVTGLVRRPLRFDLEKLLRTFPQEERRYRHRCVEAWAMAVPWTGFPLKELLARADPLASARYVRFVSFQRPEEAGRQKDDSQPWPYTEGLTIEEAANELAFLATGIYGHPLLKQHGAPVRLVVPWKYGFKSAKSLVRIELTAEQPATFWNTIAGHEYGFQANVNPDVPHPRWSQKTERMLGTDEVRPTQLYNGYGRWVASLYPS